MVLQQDAHPMTEDEKWQASLDSAQKAVVQNPDHMDPYLKRGFAYRMLGHYIEALADYHHP
jgi:regulator of sirC expression with transglutaminase-like and TPR domain